MTGTTFKTAVAPVAETIQQSGNGDPSKVEIIHVDPPFTEFRNQNKVPFTAKYIEAPLTWDEQDMVGDVMKVENYLTDLVYRGELSNSTKAAKDKLIKLEKMAGIDKLESKAQRLIKLATFVEYLTNLDKRTNGTQDRI